MRIGKGWFRLGIVILGITAIGFALPFLNIYHFSQFNSGVSTIIGLIAFIWVTYEIISWIRAGFIGKGPSRF